MAVNNNADDYAASRIGIFFPANNSTSADGNLTGQCVTLVKWFMAEMASVPSPFAARGDARYVGGNLVAQGLADRVPAGQQRRGDIVAYEYGQYGHIAVVLSGNRIFQENANVAGANRRVLSDGTVVYSAVVSSMFPSLGGVGPSFYRLRSYVEKGSEQMIIQNAENWYSRCNKTMVQMRGRTLGRDEFANFVGKEFLTYVEAVSDNPEADQATTWQTVGKTAVTDKWDQQIYALQDQVKVLNSRPTQEQLQAAQDAAKSLADQVTSANAAAQDAKEKYDAIQTEVIASQKTGNAFLLWLGTQLNKLLGKG